MYVKGNTVYADAYKYLKHKERNIVALSVKGNPDDYEEVSMDMPLEVKVNGNMISWNKGMFMKNVSDLSYEGIKSTIIKSRYSNDDQIAIMLNKDESEEKRMYFDKMQQWREFAAGLTKAALLVTS
ncbi:MULTISPECIES: hypothetical protein [Bacteroides]|jgi:hypothetical protein|uniref:hypothetical protein n=1 Tax=Bacteroides TaxID=816 RepID=UPI000E500271|nr:MULTISPECIES: hypothetical protein [Bacteroides]RGY28194.1 hypothetical protein DXA46_23810 [Bacteroides sp. OF02-3LB]